MRRIVLFDRVSADGYYATPDGGLDWAVPDDALDRAAAADMPHSDASTGLRAMGEWIDGATKLVFSRSLQTVRWRNSRLLSEFTPEAVRAFQREPGKDIMVFGSGSIVSLLIEHDLIDQYTLVVSPILLGAGRPWFKGRQKTLKLIAAESYPSGNVRLRYDAAR
jgi:dihydrofolate reductase